MSNCKKQTGRIKQCKKAVNTYAMRKLKTRKCKFDGEFDDDYWASGDLCAATWKGYVRQEVRYNPMLADRNLERALRNLGRAS